MPMSTGGALHVVYAWRRRQNENAGGGTRRTNLGAECAGEPHVLGVPGPDGLGELAIALTHFGIDLFVLALIGVHILEQPHALVELDLLCEDALPERARLLELFLLAVKEGLKLKAKVAGGRKMRRKVRHGGNRGRRKTVRKGGH